MIECLSATGEPEYDRISRAFYKYRDRRGMETEKILVEDSKAFRFGTQEPPLRRGSGAGIRPRARRAEGGGGQEVGAPEPPRAPRPPHRPGPGGGRGAPAPQPRVRDTANEKDEDKAEIRRFYEELVSRILGV